MLIDLPLPITFPIIELLDIKERLDQYGDIYTTRMGEELDRYEVGDVVYHPYLGLLVVENIQEFQDVRQHPFYDELTPEQIKILDGCFSVVHLIK